MQLTNGHIYTALSLNPNTPKALKIKSAQNVLAVEKKIIFFKMNKLFTSLFLNYRLPDRVKRGD